MFLVVLATDDFDVSKRHNVNTCKFSARPFLLSDITIVMFFRYIEKYERLHDFSKIMVNLCFELRQLTAR